MREKLLWTHVRPNVSSYSTDAVSHRSTDYGTNTHADSITWMQRTKHP